MGWASEPTVSKQKFVKRAYARLYLEARTVGREYRFAFFFSVFSVRKYGFLRMHRVRGVVSRAGDCGTILLCRKYWLLGFFLSRIGVSSVAIHWHQTDTKKNEGLCPRCLLSPILFLLTCILSCDETKEQQSAAFRPFCIPFEVDWDLNDDRCLEK